MYQLKRKSEANDNKIKQNSIPITESLEQLEYLTFPSLERTGIVKHLFTTRVGGVSSGDLATLNLSFSRGDAEENVQTNYNRVARVLDCSPEDMVASHQTHTVNIRHVTARDRGKGITRPRDYTDVDGLMTNEPGIVLVTYYADCVPLFFVDPANRAIGLAHSGWRGTASGMGARMVEAMNKTFGTRPEELYTAIGPSVCVDCYEVSEDVAEKFSHFPGVVKEGRKAGKYQLDLWQANRLILEEAGVPSERIAVTDICTCCNWKYLFSHRASEGKRGNLGAFLALSRV